MSRSLFRWVSAARRSRHLAAESFGLFAKMFELVASDWKAFTPRKANFDCLENRDAAAVERVIHELIEPMERFYRADVRGIERVSASPQLFVGNHSGGPWSPEIFLFGAAMYRRFGLERLPYGLAHEIVAAGPGSHLLIPLGAVRASPENARRIFAAGRNILVFPGGDEESVRKSTLRDEVLFFGRRGYIRLALRHGVPITPVVTFGAHDVFWVLSEGRWLASALGLDKRVRMKTFPIMLCAPWGIAMGPLSLFMPWPARVCVEVLAPMQFERSGEAAASDPEYVAQCDTQVRSVMQATLTRLAAEHRGGVTPDQLPQRAPDNDQLSRATGRVA